LLDAVFLYGAYGTAGVVHEILGRGEWPARVSRGPSKQTEVCRGQQ
jgi:hypothetical protein